MIRNILIAALVVAPITARAEFIAKKQTETRPASKVASQPLTIEGMLGKINSVYMQGMQRCYVKALSQDSSLNGKVTATFTVSPAGKVSGSVAGIGPKVDACLSSQLTQWRFPSPRDGKGTTTEASFRLSLILRQ